MKYYGFDWLAMLASLAAMYLLGNKNRSGFVAFMIANFSWIVIGYWAESLAISLGNVAFFVMNLRGFIRWQATQQSAETETKV